MKLRANRKNCYMNQERNLIFYWMQLMSDVNPT